MKYKYAKRLLIAAVTATMLATSLGDGINVNAETVKQETDATSESDAITEADAADQSGSTAEAVPEDSAQDEAVHNETQEDNIAVTSEQYDTTAPVIEGVTIDKQGQELGDDDIFQISVKTYDMDSEVKQGYVSVTSDGGNRAYSYELNQYNWNEQTGCYEVSVKLSDTNLSGKVYISSLYVEDTKGNRAWADVAEKTQDGQETSSANEKNALYWFTAKRNDSEKPVIKSVKIAQNGQTVKPGDTLQFTVEATDNAALKEECQLSFIYSDKMDSKVQSINLKWDNDAKCYRGSLDITENMHPGEWHIDKVCVEDTAGNQADIDYEKFAENKVTIENDNFDTEEPKIISFSIDKAGQTLKAGDQVTFTAEVTDNKGVGSVYISMKYTSDDRSGIVRPLKQVDGTDKYECTYTVSDKDYPCEYYVSSIQASDLSGNYARIFDSSKLTGSEKSRPLSYDYYYNVTQDGTFTQPEYYVILRYLNADMEVQEKKVTVPRRTTAEQLKELFVPDVQIPGVEFTGWSQDLVLENSGAHAEYTKDVVEKYIYSEQDGQFNELYHKLSFVEKGTKADLPTSMPGIKNIKWHSEVGYYGIQASTWAADYLYEAEGEVDTSTPSTGDNKDNNGSTTDDDKNHNNGNSNQGEEIKLSSEKIQENVTKIIEAKAGDTVSVSMGDATVAPKDILEAAKGKDINVVLEMNGYKWTINGKNIKSEKLKDINLAVNTNANAIPNDVVSNLAGSNPVKQISLAYSGDFGFQASLSYNIGNEYAGKFGNLYYYDSTGRMIFQNAGAIDASGNVSLKFSHASEYAVVITDTPLTTEDQNLDSKPNNNQTTNSDQQNNVSGNNGQSGNIQTAVKTNTAAQFAKTAKAQKTGDNNAAALYLVLCGMGIAAAGVAVKRKKNA
ncbi:MAG: hypothetical protein SPH96_04595 [Agathobacter sp.]|nr:hypothetical protein [Agathobacter sp.]